MKKSDVLHVTPEFDRSGVSCVKNLVEAPPRHVLSVDNKGKMCYISIVKSSKASS